MESLVTVNINTLTIQFLFHFTCPQPCESAELSKPLSVLTSCCAKTFSHDQQTMRAVIIQDSTDDAASLEDLQ